ncbi:MAG: hypothetical protein HY093_02610 [Candidatus Liptonbacteria bacterium]|nr:hypothetical protein [Candidatus Liptonbacteria bacterium]
MGKNKFIQELLISLAFIILLVLVANPFDFWMPSTLTMTAAMLLVATFGVFAVFVWREKAADEREKLHRLMAGRFAYLLGAAGLTAGIVVQSLSHAIDPWLVISLAFMVLGKIVSLIYSRQNF